jgi:prephenate dehydrogenase
MTNEDFETIKAAADSFAYLSKIAIDMMIENGDISKSQELDANLAATKILSQNPQMAMDIVSKDKNVQVDSINKFFDEIKREMGIKEEIVNNSPKFQSKWLIFTIIALTILVISVNS